MNIENNTPLKDVLAEYPWLPDELIKMDPRFKVLKSPIGRFMLRNATVEDAVKKTGLSKERLLEELDKLIKKHEESQE